MGQSESSLVFVKYCPSTSSPQLSPLESSTSSSLLATSQFLWPSSASAGTSRPNSISLLVQADSASQQRPVVAGVTPPFEVLATGESRSEQQSAAYIDAVNAIVNGYDVAMVCFLLPVTIALNFLALLVFGGCHSSFCKSMATLSILIIFAMYIQYY